MATKKNLRFISLGKNRGKNRIWLQSKSYLADAGFTIGSKFTAELKPNKLTLTIDKKNGTRTVTGKGDTAIIDINTDKLQFDSTALQVDVQKGRIVIKPRKGE